jgi:hypothetical protein
MQQDLHATARIHCWSPRPIWAEVSLSLTLLLSLSLSLPFNSPSLFLPLAVADIRRGVRHPRGPTVPAGAGDSSNILCDRGLCSVDGDAVRQVADLRHQRREASTSPRSSASLQCVLEHPAAHWFVGPMFASLKAEGICKCSVCFLSEYEWCECSLYFSSSVAFYVIYFLPKYSHTKPAVAMAMLMIIQFAKTLHCIIVQFVNNVDSNTSIIKPLLFHFSLQFSGWTS